MEIGAPHDSDNNNDNDDDAQLSPLALAALQEFLRERQQLEEKFERLKEAAERDFVVPSMDLFVEDFQLSQFWYDAETCDVLARELLRQGTRIACISAPSAFARLHALIVQDPQFQHAAAAAAPEEYRLLEFDQRFNVFGADRFVPYDYRRPLDFTSSSSLEAHSFDVILADPPFLSEECLTKTAETIRYLAKENTKIILCTGQVMELLARSLLSLKMVHFEPQHASGLSNEFRCFTNYTTTAMDNADADADADQGSSPFRWRDQTTTPGQGR